MANGSLARGTKWAALENLSTTPRMLVLSCEVVTAVSTSVVKMCDKKNDLVSVT